MPRRANGEGSIIRRPDGRWQGSLQVNARRVTVYGRTKSEVSEKLRLYHEQAKVHGGLPTHSRLTLREFAASWLESIRSRIRPATYSGYESVLRLYILPELGSMRLSRLTAFGLSVHFMELSRTCGIATVHKTREALHKALADAVRLGLLTANPVSAVSPPKKRPKERPLWTPEQVQTFLSGMLAGMGGHYGNLWIFLLASGCRLGEALSLTRKEVDFVSGRVRIEKAVGYVGGKPVEGPPKTKAGRRTISLPNWCVEALETQVAQAIWYGGGRIFATRQGNVPWRRSLLREFHAACRRTGVPEIRIHDLRHLHASLLAMNGVSVKVAQERLGHSTPTVTLGIYSHVLGGADRTASDALECLREQKDA